MTRFVLLLAALSSALVATALASAAAQQPSPTPPRTAGAPKRSAAQAPPILRGPSLIVAAPRSGLETSASAVVVRGRAASARGIAFVSVNRKRVAQAKGGWFSARVALSPGSNKILVAAYDRAQMLVYRIVYVTRTAG